MKTKSIEQIVADAEIKTAKLIKQSAGVRAHYQLGRPNNSEESTVLGSMKALGVILDNWPPKQPAPETV